VLARAASADGGLAVEARAAWGGVARAGAWTEVAVAVVSDVGGPARAAADGGAGTVAAAAMLDADAPATLRVPVRVDERGAIDVALDGPAGVWEGAVAVRVAAPDAAVVAHPAGLALDPPAGALAVGITAGDVPERARSFAAVDVVVLDATLSARLAPAARAAVDAHVAGCGRLVGVALPEAERARLHAGAGCGGAFVAFAADGAAAAGAAERLLARRAPPAALAPEAVAGARPSAAARPLAAFFALYAAALGLGAIAVRRVALLVALPIGGTALLALAVAGAAPRVTAVAVAEGESDAPSARVRVRIVLDGVGRATAAVAVPSALAPFDAAAPAVVEVGAHGADAVVALPLGGRRVLDAAGVVPWEPPVRLVAAADGPRATGRRAGGAGWLVWRRRIVALPALAPGETWRPADAGPPPAAVPPWLDALRRVEDGPLVVLPGGPPALARLGGTTPIAVTVIRPEAR